MIGQPISRERWLVLEPLLDAVLELDEQDRAAYTDAACAHDPTLHAELSALVLACDHGTTLLSQSAEFLFAPFLAELDAPPPTHVDHYRIVRELGSGGMATVYLADDPKHGRQVALKVLRAQVARLVGRERFLREIEIAAGLSHPHILPLHDSGETKADPSLLYFVSPYVAGESLRDVLTREGRLSAQRVADFGGEIARALDYAHRQGVVHLDIKPGNILVQEGHAVIADFGIARAVSHVSDAQASATVPLGTPYYMSPEQAAGTADIDGRSDIYSLGCMLYEMLTGTRTRVMPSTATARPNHFTAAEPDPDVLAASGAPLLAAVIARATALDRDKRFANAGEMAQAIHDSATDPAPPPRRRSIWRGRIMVGTMVVVAGASVLAARHQLARSRKSQIISAISREKSIAVLPFANASGDSDEVYLSDGISEDIIKRLARSNDMRVASRAASFKYNGTPLDTRTIGRQLDVAYLLRGGVRYVNDTLHVTAELLNTEDGTAVWSSRYDRPLDEIFTIQKEIATRSVQALKTTLLANALTTGASETSADAYNLVLRGRYLISQPNQQSVARAVECFQQAIRIEPKNALAFAWLSRARTTQAGQGWMSRELAQTLARDDARQAIALDPELADGYEALAVVQSTYQWDWEAAQSNYQRALALEPGNAEVLRTAAILMTKLGHFDEAIVGLQKAVERDPSVGAYSGLSYTLGAAGRWRDAEAPARAALALGPNSVLRHFNLARALLFQDKTEAALREMELEKKESWRLMGLAVTYHALGRRAESNRMLASLERQYASTSAMQIAEVHAYRGDRDSAFAWLERARAERDPGITDLLDDPWLSSVRKDPRYAVLLKQVRLPM